MVTTIAVLHNIYLVRKTRGNPDDLLNEKKMEKKMAIHRTLFTSECPVEHIADLTCMVPT